MYAHGFRIYFTPLPGFFSPFPHGTGSLSVDHEYLALEDGPPIFRQDLRPDFPFRSAIQYAKSSRLLRFRSPLLSESRLMSFPRATEMFQFTRFASTGLCGHLRINACLPAPRSFSQATTSFIACDRQGIHHVHLVA